MGSTHGCDEKDSHTEGEDDDSFPRGCFLPTPTDQAVSDPAANRFGNTEREEREGSIKTCLYDTQPADRDQIVGQPRYKYIPVIVEAEESQADSQQIAIEQAPGERSPRKLR